MFPLISSITAAAAASCIIQQQSHKSPQAANQKSSFSCSFISSSKQEGEATVLREEHNIVIRVTCILNINNLGKASVLHFASCFLLQLGHAKLSL
jgi:hypothetical protein